MSGAPFTRIVWAPAEGLSDRARAASVGLVLLRLARVPTWDELGEFLRTDDPLADALRTRSSLPLAELENLDAHEGTLRGLRMSIPADGSRARTRVLVSVAECDACGRWAFVPGSGTVPKRCPWTDGCTGSPHRIGEAEHTVRKD